MYVHCAVDLGKIAIGNHLRRLIADADLEAGRTPVDELNGALGLESGDGTMGILGHDISTVEQTGGHVLSITRVALDHLVVGFEAGHGNFLNRVRLVRSLGGGDHGRVCNQGEVDAWIWHQIRLELVQVNVKRTIEAE